MGVAVSPSREHEQLGGSGPLVHSAALGPGVEGRTECQAGRLARSQTSGWTSSLADRQANEELEKQPQGQVGRALSPPPPGSAPAPMADTARPGAQIYLPMLPQSAIGFVITDSNVHGINILTN